MSAKKCRDYLRIFQFASAIHQQKELPKSQQKLLYIKPAMASAYLSILPSSMIYFSPRNSPRQSAVAEVFCRGK